MTTVIKRHAHVNNFDDSLDPYDNLFKDVSEFDFFTLLVSIKLPTLRDTILLLALSGFVDLMNESSVN